MQTQTAVPTAPGFLFTLANPDQGSTDKDQSNNEELEGVEAVQHVSHGDTTGQGGTVATATTGPQSNQPAPKN